MIPRPTLSKNVIFYIRLAPPVSGTHYSWSGRWNQQSSTKAVTDFETSVRG